MMVRIDCMMNLDDPDAGLSKQRVEPAEILVLVVENASDLKKRRPELFADLMECAAFVNWRRIERGAVASARSSAVCMS